MAGARGARADGPGDGQGSAAGAPLAAEIGGRTPVGASRLVLAGAALAWSLFQLWYASPLPFMVGTVDFGLFRIGTVLNDTEARSIHLAFAIFLAFVAFPALKRSPRSRIPVQDWVLAAVAAGCAAYLWLFYAELAARTGLATTADIVVACTGILLLLEATRRALGPPLTIVATVFLAYAFLGPWMPGVISHRGETLASVANHQWLTTNGVFGVPLGVSTGFVFLFVLFGALLDRAGAGNYFIKLAFGLLGHLRGGPAKAAVVASGMTGLISGSSIANTVTTGTFTIPLMMRVGFSSTKAGAIEVAASTNGQLTPPVMGAAAFLMVEYVGISYFEVIRHAFLPAVISYIALIYIVHLEAVKANMEGLPKPAPVRPFAARMLGLLTGFVVTAALAVGFHHALGWMPSVLGAATPWIAGLVLFLVYVALVGWAAAVPDLEVDDPRAPVAGLPRPGHVFRTGAHFLLPIAVLVYCLMVMRLSPGLSAFWATAGMIFILLTQRPLKAAFRGARLRGRAGLLREALGGVGDLSQGLERGARNMVGIGVATATAGIIVGVVAQTGLGAGLAQVVEAISFGSMFVILLWTALLCVILGMGLPTTANYIVVASLLAPVIVVLGQQEGLIVPLIAVHLFVFYFGILADDTPPVGLAAFAAAAISRGDPIMTGVQGFFYDLRTAVLPFMFIYNPQLLLIDVTWGEGILVFVVATVAALIFAAATQGRFLARNRAWETVAMLLIAFALFRPGFWMDRAVAPWDDVPGIETHAALDRAAKGDRVRFEVSGLDPYGRPMTRFQEIRIGDGATGRERAEELGLVLVEEDGELTVDMVAFDSPAARAGSEPEQRIDLVRLPVEQPPKELVWIPALLLLLGIALLQRRREATHARRRAETPPVRKP